VVDDDRSAAHLLSRLLTRLGCEVKAVDSGEAALDALAGFAPQAVIADQEMPAMKGNELARRIRSGSAPWPVLIALSGYEAGSSQSPDLASDFDHVLSKPAGLEALERLLASIAATSH
jgi:CheY-like chemotaxis protein